MTIGAAAAVGSAVGHAAKYIPGLITLGAAGSKIIPEVAKVGVVGQAAKLLPGLLTLGAAGSKIIPEVVKVGASGSKFIPGIIKVAAVGSQVVPGLIKVGSAGSALVGNVAVKVGAAGAAALGVTKLTAAITGAIKSATLVIGLGKLAILPFLIASLVFYNYDLFDPENRPFNVKTLDREYDFIIVGAGSAGSILANRLSEIEDWKILLIEAGGHETEISDVPLLSLYLHKSKLDWKYRYIFNLFMLKIVI